MNMEWDLRKEAMVLCYPSTKGFLYPLRLWQQSTKETNRLKYSNPGQKLNSF